MATEENGVHDLFAALRVRSSGAQPSQSNTEHPLSPAHVASASAPRSFASTPPTQLYDAPQQDSEAFSVSSEKATDRSADLLSLLRFSQNSQRLPSSVPSANRGSTKPSLLGDTTTQNIHGRGVSASDLVASFMGKPSGTSQRDGPAVATSTMSPAPAGNPQDYLLRLLNRSQPAASPPILQQPSPPPAIPDRQRLLGDSSIPSSQSSNIEDDVTNNRKDNTEQDVPQRKVKSPGSSNTPHAEQSIERGRLVKTETATNPIFTYVNPFEQLAASSPRNTPSRSENLNQRKEIPHIPRLDAEAGIGREGREETRQRFDLVGEVQAIETSSNDLPIGQKASTNPLHGIRAPTTDPATVAQALNEVSEQVSRQADFALAQAEEAKHKAKKANFERATDLKSKKRAPGQVTEAKNPTVESNESAFTSMSHDIANEAKKMTDQTTQARTGAHESADDEKSSVNGEDNVVVPVYNFVMKPFVSIEIIDTDHPSIQFREDSITDIARLKKEFDQVDRTLATASPQYIIYSLPKSGGIRVIRQEDGVDRQIFKDTKDHVFNVAVSSSQYNKPSMDLQTSIATATSGTVYWTALHHKRDNLETADIQQHCLAFPPVAANDEHASGGQLKTRAKRSSRHPELFAIGRGRLIQIIFPLHAARSRFVKEGRIVDTEAYFKDRSLKINTGKAGKDFTFSEDDTVIATLDKAGRLRFWDVRELVIDYNNDAPLLPPIEIRTPILTLSTSVPTEKSWPTSVLFVDKLRAYVKGTALRYVIVGMKQNHTLQLWDLGIGKAIQEVHFPHSKESDAICSVCYHPGSGIIVVGHPTRNSIYFIHLSAPKYNLPSMNQARYLIRLADKDSSLPKPEATAIMSGMREYSFAPKGQLRSVDILPVSNETLLNKDQPGLFELYVMHSKGVTMLGVQREDLGWSENMKVLYPLNAQEEGVISIKELVQPPTAVVSENSSVNGDVAPATNTKKSSNALIKIFDKDKVAADDTDPGDVKDRGASQTASATEKPEKRKKKKTALKEDSIIPPPAPVVPTYANAASKSAPARHDKEQNRPSKHSSNARVEDFPRPEVETTTIEASNGLISKELKKIQSNISEEFEKAFETQLGTLYKRINEDKQVRDAQHGADREALLRLISSHLGTNLEAALKQIVFESVEHQLVPSVQEVVTSTLKSQLNNTTGQTSQNGSSKDLSSALPKAINRAFQSSELLNTLSANVTTKVVEKVEKMVKTALDVSREASNRTTRELLQESEIRVKNSMSEALKHYTPDNAKISELTKTVADLSTIVRKMVESQNELRSEVARLHAANGRSGPLQDETPVSNQAGLTIESAARDGDNSEEGAELTTIMSLMRAGEVEGATVKWLQSQHQAVIFDKFFVNLDPYYLQQCSSLVTLSVAAAVTASLENHLDQKLTWLDVILSSITYQDPDIKDVAPKIMDVLCQRLEACYMQLADQDAGNPRLMRIVPLSRKAREIFHKSQA